LRALIVEDSEQDSSLLIRELRRGGYDLSFERVETADAMQAALDNKVWDVVLSDYSMPRFSAPAALALVRGRQLDLPFIIVSGTIGEETAVTSLRAGAHDFLVKGSLARLVPAIERELGEATSRSEKRKMEEQLLISERMASVGLLAASVAHEINNPLAILVSNLELVAQQVDTMTANEACDAAPAHHAAMRLFDLAAPLRDAQEAAERVRLIVGDLKVLSGSRDTESRGPVDIRSVMESAIRMASNEIRHRARLVRDYANVLPVCGNESRLVQVFLNLIVNAAHAIPQGHAESNEIKCVIRTEPSGLVAVEIHDTGGGIAADALPHIFESFFTTKPATQGTGLGLAICRRIVNDHHGEMTVKSKVGVGTVFRTLLPATTENAAEGATAAPEVVAVRRGRILAVDDEPMLCTVIKRILRDHDVTTVTSATAAIQSLDAGERYDLILCDLMMPEMSGMDFYARLQQIAPDQAWKIRFMTGGAFTEETQAFLAQFPSEPIEKPFSTAKLRAQVQRFLR
jgi:signal transduction histidine kinase